MKLVLERPIIFFDLETTGTDIESDRIVQMFFIKVFIDGTEQEKGFLVNPGMPIPPEASMVHGIYDIDVKDQPDFKTLARDLFNWLDGCDFAGYNSDSFDIPILSSEFYRCGIIFPEENVDTIDILKIERRINSHKLSETYKRYTGKEMENAHDAGADARATRDILYEQLKKNHDIPCIPYDLSRFLNRGAKRVDISGKLIKKNNVVCFNFGKYRGKPIAEHQDYIDWMLSGDFHEETKEKLKKFR